MTTQSKIRPPSGDPTHSVQHHAHYGPPLIKPEQAFVRKMLQDPRRLEVYGRFYRYGFSPTKILLSLLIESPYGEFDPVRFDFTGPNEADLLNECFDTNLALPLAPERFGSMYKVRALVLAAAMPDLIAFFRIMTPTVNVHQLSALGRKAAVDQPRRQTSKIAPPPGILTNPGE